MRKHKELNVDLLCDVALLALCSRENWHSLCKKKLVEYLDSSYLEVPSSLLNLFKKALTEIAEGIKEKNRYKTVKALVMLFDKLSETEKDYKFTRFSLYYIKLIPDDFDTFFIKEHASDFFREKKYALYKFFNKYN